MNKTNNIEATWSHWLAVWNTIGLCARADLS
jgi:hypothetical protein